MPMEQGDMAMFLFTEEIPFGLQRWENLLAGRSKGDNGLSLKDELKRQAEVFATLGAMLDLPGFTSIAQTAIKALEVNPKYTTKIAQLALADFWAGHKAVLEGDRAQGGQLNETLVKLTKPLKPKKAVGTTNKKQVSQPIKKSHVANQIQVQKAEINNRTKTTAHNATTLSENVSDQQDYGLEVTHNQKTEQVNKSTKKSHIANQNKSQKAEITNRKKTQNSNAATLSGNVLEQQDYGAEVTDNQKQVEQKQTTSQPSYALGIRIDLKNLEILNNLVGDLATQENSFMLQNIQAQASIETLDKGWQKIKQLMINLQDINVF